MRKGSIKSDRINREVERTLSEVIRSELKDPRIHPMTSVTGAEVTMDLKYCRVSVSVLASDEEKAATMEGLKQARAFLRKRLAETVNLRNTPELRFVLDEGIEYGMHLSKLIEDVSEADRKVIAEREKNGEDPAEASGSAPENA